MSVRWLAESFDGETLIGRVGRDGDRLVAEWPDRARFESNADGSDRRFEALPGARDIEVEKLRRGAARLLIAHLRGGIPLHASAVAIAGRAAVFVGGSGLGKSTLAATLGEHRGASLLGDDAVAIERGEGDSFEVIALEESHWLDASAAVALGRSTKASGDGADGDKVPHAPRATGVGRAPLALIAHLAFDDTLSAPRLVDVTGLDAVTGLLAQLTRFVVDDPAIARRDLAALAELTSRTRIVRLERPRRLDLLRSTADLIGSVLDASTKETP
jgi:hypothetical protein